MEMALLNCSETTGPSTTTTLETLTTFVRSIKFPSRRPANLSWRSTRRCRFRRSQSVVVHSLFVLHKNPAKWQEVSEMRHTQADTKKVSLQLVNGWISYFLHAAVAVIYIFRTTYTTQHIFLALTAELMTSCQVLLAICAVNYPIPPTSAYDHTLDGCLLILVVQDAIMVKEGQMDFVPQNYAFLVHFRSFFSIQTLM